VGGAIQARFVALTEDSAPWPCELPAANSVKLQVAETGVDGGGGGDGGPGPGAKTLVAQAELEPSEIQDLGDLIPQLLEIKTKIDMPLKFRVRIEFGDGEQDASPESVASINELLESIRAGFKIV
jgi:hypothetical protein